MQQLPPDFSTPQIQKTIPTHSQQTQPMQTFDLTSVPYQFQPPQPTLTEVTPNNNASAPNLISLDNILKQNMEIALNQSSNVSLQQHLATIDQTTPQASVNITISAPEITAPGTNPASSKSKYTELLNRKNQRNQQLVLNQQKIIENQAQLLIQY